MAVIVETTLEAVAVFPDRARITRRGRATVEAGIQVVEVKDLPTQLLPESVRAAGRGTARARLLGVSTRLEQLVETPAETVRALETELLTAQDAGADLAWRMAAIGKEQTSLEALGAQSEMFARGLILRQQPPAAQAAILDFIRDRLRAGQAELQTLTREKRENDKRVDQLKRELQHYHAARVRQRYCASVEVEVAAAGELELELVYMVTGAQWTSLYDLRLSGAALEVTYLAQVQQTTGEDWAGVVLTLSTAQPALALTAPELEPWYIAPRAPIPPPAAMPARAMLAAAAPPQAKARQVAEAQPEADAAAYELAAFEPATATVSDAGAALRYEIAGRADVPGNGDPRKVTVARFPLQPVLDYVTAPRLQAACYRRAKVKNETPYTLLPGSAQLFEGDDYLGATTLEFVAPQQEIELFLGADERLRVERELTAREVDKTLLGDRRRIRYAYALTVENLRDQAQTVWVRDQLPVARDEQIKVRLDGADPKPTTHDDLNRLEWKLTLAPGKHKVRFEFTVEHPRALNVIGLP